jgi:hypothetical protein
MEIYETMTMKSCTIVSSSILLGCLKVYKKHDLSYDVATASVTSDSKHPQSEGDGLCIGMFSQRPEGFLMAVRGR